MQNLKNGSCWPCLLEFQSAAHVYGKDIEVFTADETGFKPAFELSPEVKDEEGFTDLWRFEYKNEEHYEPLLCMPDRASPKTDELAPPPGKQVKMIGGNICSFDKHGEKPFTLLRRARPRLAASRRRDWCNSRNQPMMLATMDSIRYSVTHGLTKGD